MSSLWFRVCMGRSSTGKLMSRQSQELVILCGSGPRARSSAVRPLVVVTKVYLISKTTQLWRWPRSTFIRAPSTGGHFLAGPGSEGLDPRAIGAAVLNMIVLVYRALWVYVKIVDLFYVYLSLMQWINEAYVVFW